MPKSFASKSSAYPTLDGLFDLACRDGVDIRPTLLRVLTDLYVQKPVHTAEEEAQYAELASRLIEAVDEPTRSTVAGRLAGYPAAPAAILRALGMAGTATKPAPAAEPAQPDLAALFFTANPEERRLILTNLDVVAPTTGRPPAADDTARRLETAALQRNASEVGRLLARALGVSPRLAERIVRDPSGEPIVVAAKVLGMAPAVLQRILLFLDPAVGQSIARVHGLARLFDEITPGAALRMLSIWRQADTKPAAKPAHAPLHYDDERRSARAASTPAEHRRSYAGKWVMTK
jgi:hypothetical protein